MAINMWFISSKQFLIFLQDISIYKWQELCIDDHWCKTKKWTIARRMLILNITGRKSTNPQESQHNQNVRTQMCV